jgi:hypothetical protein
MIFQIFKILRIIMQNKSWVGYFKFDNPIVQIKDNNS